MLAGVTHASRVIALLALAASISFVAAPAESITVEALTTNPPLAIQRMAVSSCTMRSNGTPTPETSVIVVPLPSVNG